MPPVAAAAGDALAELLGLNKSPSEILGDAVGLAAGLAAAEVVGFLRARFGLGDAAGDSAVSAGDAVAADFLCVRGFFAGEGDSAGAGD